MLVSILYFNSCSTYDSDDLSANNPVPVRIALVIENQLGSKPATRAAGTVTEENYSQNHEPGNSDESFIGTLRLLVFDSEGLLKFNKVFSKNAALTEDKFEIDPATGRLTVQLKLYSGMHEFRAVTNEAVLWNLGSLVVGSSTLSDYQTLTSIQNITNTITDEALLSADVSSGKGIPMLGAQQFMVYGNIDATVTNPIVLSTINLKRALAKVEVNLTNVDSSTGLVYDYAKNYTIKSVGLYSINQKYNLLENVNTPVTESNSSILNPITHSVGTLFPKQRVLIAYMAERKNVTEATKTYIVVTTDKQGETITYTIPLYSTTDQTILGTKDYNRHYIG